MTIKAQLIVIAIIIVAMVVLINMVRKHQLELRYALSWFVVGVLILILACFPKLMEYCANIVGIASPVNMLFFFGFCFVMGLVFMLTYSASRMSNRIKELAQELALLRKEIKNNNEE